MKRSKMSAERPATRHTARRRRVPRENIRIASSGDGVDAAERKAQAKTLVAYLSYALDEVRAISPDNIYYLEMLIEAIEEGVPQGAPEKKSQEKSQATPPRGDSKTK